jgi:phosphatidylglycerol:prolipoprotein diacylglycerol transferase
MIRLVPHFALAAISYEPLVRIRLGPLAVSPHGIATALAFLAGTAVMLPAARRRGLSEELVYGIVTRALLGGVVGARFFYVLNNFSSFDSPFEWLAIWEGGISLLGGIVGAVIANLGYLRRHGHRFFQVMDAAVAGLALGIGIGRIGDLVIADHLGTPTDLPFGFRCPAVVDVGRTVGSRCPPGEVVHLSALYDLVAVSVVLGLVLWARRRSRPEGEFSLIAAVAYGLGRFGFDFARADVRRLGLTGSQWVALAVVLVACAALVYRRGRGSGIPMAPADIGGTEGGGGVDGERGPEMSDAPPGRWIGEGGRSSRRVEQAEEPRPPAGDHEGQHQVELAVPARDDVDVEDGQVVDDGD